MVGRDQVLLPVLYPFHRSAELTRGPADQYVLGVELAPDPESAAHVSFPQHHQMRRHAQHGGQRRPVVVRHFRGAVNVQRAGRPLIVGHGAPALQWHAGMPPDPDRELDDMAGLRESGCHVTVSVLEEQGLGVVLGVERSRGGAGIEDRDQRLDVQLHGIRRILRDVRVCGDYDRHRFPYVANARTGQNRLAVGKHLRETDLSELDRPQVDGRARPDRDDAGHGPGGADIDGMDNAVRHRRPHDPHMRLPVQADVGGEPPGSGKQGQIFDPQHGIADHWRITLAAARTALVMFW